jgi:CRISPR-associated endonuclease/helicase Cas3
MTPAEQFSSDFRTLNRVGAKDGPQPLKWQTRLFERLCANEIPKACDLPTGMGKTSVIHLWMLALRFQLSENIPRLPTRLVYVVDRRTVVDQATDAAERIQRNLPGLGLPKDWLSVSTLRGQFADNREWASDPSRPAIIIGTVDMIGSRLLFSGYRSSFKLRPLDAGMLGQDALLVLDEAHLSQPFEKLIRSVENFQGNHGTPMRAIFMSATTTIRNESDRVKLELTDLEGDEDTNPILRRYNAKKRLVVEPPVEKNQVKKAIFNAAVDLAKTRNGRVVVFTRSPEDAVDIARNIRKHFQESVEVLTGTMRGLERDELLVEKPVLQRFLNGEEEPEDKSGNGPVFLVATSAGEVGFDLNADHMVCDSVPIDSMIQRLGRVNRRGYGDANIHVIIGKAEEKTKAKKSQWEAATAAAIECLKQLPRNEDGAFDASPRAIDQLKRRLPNEFQSALSPSPATVELTDILLDAWSTTTIVRPMPGRPPVAPWLRGINEEEPQTNIAWRAELDVPGFGELGIEDIEDWFDAHRVLAHETLAVTTRTACERILRRWEKLSTDEQIAVGEKRCIVERAGLQTLPIKSLIDQLERKRPDSNPIRNCDIILPASFGGIERREGLLNEDAPKPVESADGLLSYSGATPDVADERDRHRFLRTDGVDDPLVGPMPEDLGKFARFALDLPSDRDVVRQLISLVPKRHRLEYGTDPQALQTHVSLVEKYAGEIARRLHLSEDICESFRLAAKWHDNGKIRERWQAAAGREPGEEPRGKSGGFMGRIAGGYRHEFGSLREFAEALQGKIPEETFDLGMHLIATHHGRGRPHFPKGGFDPDARAMSADIALETVRRFVRLQRRYGYWRLAWLENLLRCADAMASGEKVGPA